MDLLVVALVAFVVTEVGFMLWPLPIPTRVEPFVLAGAALPTSWWWEDVFDKQTALLAVAATALALIIRALFRLFRALADREEVKTLLLINRPKL